VSKPQDEHPAAFLVFGSRS